MQMTEHHDEPPKNARGHNFPQEVLDLIWNSALEPWLKKRVIVLDCLNSTGSPGNDPGREQNRLHFSFECTNPPDAEASELVGNIRRVDRRARNTVSLSLSRAPRDMFPESPDLSRRHLGRSFKAQHADFQHDVFWLSRGFIDLRFLYIREDRNGHVHPDMLSLNPPQPLHMMLSMRHMLAVMQMIFDRDTPCLGRQQREARGYDDPLRDFHRVVQINRTERLRTLTVLLPQSIDEWNGKVDYDVLEHISFGSSVEEKYSVLELARNQSNRSHLAKIHKYWSDLISLAENHRVDLPTLRFSRRRS